MHRCCELTTERRPQEVITAAGIGIGSHRPHSGMAACRKRNAEQRKMVYRECFATAPPARDKE
jgi:hypothetical protein